MVISDKYDLLLMTVYAVVAAVSHVDKSDGEECKDGVNLM